MIEARQSELKIRAYRSIRACISAWLGEKKAEIMPPMVSA